MKKVQKPAHFYYLKNEQAVQGLQAFALGIAKRTEEAQSSVLMTIL